MNIPGLNVHLIFDVDVVVQVSQASLLQARGHLLDVTAQVVEQLCVAVAGPEPQFALTGEMDRVEDVLVPETGTTSYIYRIYRDFKHISTFHIFKTSSPL